MPSSEETTATVNVEYTFIRREDNDVEIDLTEYRAWLGLQSDESFEFVESDIIEYLNSGGDVQFEVSRNYGLEDFRIEQVTFDCG